MPEAKAALIVANWKYEDGDLRQLVAPANDAEALAAVLRDPKICGFEVTTLLNRPSRELLARITERTKSALSAVERRGRLCSTRRVSGAAK